LSAVAVAVWPDENRPLSAADESALAAAWNAVGRCVPPDLDALLPRIGRTEMGEVFLIVACADTKGAKALAERIEGHLARCDDLGAAGLVRSVSFSMLKTPVGPEPRAADKLADAVAEEVSSILDDQMARLRSRSAASIETTLAARRVAA
jgi:hypothetical protein